MIVISQLRVLCNVSVAAAVVGFLGGCSRESIDAAFPPTPGTYETGTGPVEQPELPPYGQSAAQPTTPPAATASLEQSALGDWIDTKTGKHVSSLPIVPGPGKYPFGHSHVVLNEIGDPKRAFDPETGRNFAVDDCGDWIDVKTGKHVSSLPIVPGPGKYPFGHSHVVLNEIGDPKRAFDPETGRNFARVECPPSTARTTSPPPSPPAPTPPAATDSPYGGEQMNIGGGGGG